MKSRFILFVTLFFLITKTQQAIDCQDLDTVIVSKARGQVGNHIWLYMLHLALELKYGIKGYITEDTRWILNEYFKGFEEGSPTAENDLCGFMEFYSAWEHYLDQTIVNIYEEKTGVRVPIKKPKDQKYSNNRITVPSEVALKYKLNVPLLIDSPEFIQDEPNNYKTHNCPYVWEAYRNPREDLKNLNKNHAFLLYPGSKKDQTDSGILMENPHLPSLLESQLQFKDEFVSHAQAKLSQIKTKFKNPKKEFVFVGIHSRRTDHLDFQVNRLGLKPVKSSYYLDAIDLFRSKFPSKKYNLAFVYVSDDLAWGKATIGAKKGGAKHVYFIGEEDKDKGPYDLALLANCNHTIQSYGSFTYYAGFFAGGLKVIPQNFPEYRTQDTFHIKQLKLNPLDHPLPRLIFFDTMK